MNDVLPLIIIIVVTIACVAAFKSLAKNCYRKTGVNVLRGLNKLLWYAEIGAAAFLSQGARTAKEGMPILIMCILAFIVIQTLVNMKAGIKYAVISGVLHGTCGVFLAVISIFVFCLRLFFRLPGGLFDIDTTKIEVENINAQSAVVRAQVKADAERAEQVKNEQADAKAQRLGFRDADDAERAGINTGKYQE